MITILWYRTTGKVPFKAGNFKGPLGIKTLVRIVVIGDGASGKTALLTRLISNEFDQSGAYVPTIFENKAHQMTIDNQQVVLTPLGTRISFQFKMLLYDTAGQEDYSALRAMMHNVANIFVICFSVDNEDSFRNVRNVWVPEASGFNKTASMLICACKTDLRYWRWYQKSIINDLDAKIMGTIITILFFILTLLTDFFILWSSKWNPIVMHGTLWV